MNNVALYRMDRKSVSRNISETIKSGDEVFVIEINSDYSDNEENSTESAYTANYYDEIDSLQQCSEQISSLQEKNQSIISPQVNKDAKVSSPLKIGRDDDGKVNYIGLDPGVDEPPSSQLDDELPPGLENIKIVNVCTLSDDLQQDTTENQEKNSYSLKQFMGSGDFEAGPNTQSLTAPNMIIVDEQPSQSTLMVKLVCKVCQQLLPTHEALYDHSKLHSSQQDKNEHSVNEHINQQASVQNLMSNPEETIVSGKEGKVTPPKKKKSKKRKSQGKIDEENKCEKCGKIFMKDYQYKMHASLCRGKTTQMATCFECNKMIPAHEEYKHALKYHDIVCRICGANLMQESKLKSHMKFMHNISNYGKDTNATDITPQVHVVEQIFYKACIQCGKACASYDQYRLHRKLHVRMAKLEIIKAQEEEKKKQKMKNQEKNIPKEKKKKKSQDNSPVKCEKCDKMFQSSYHLRSHLKRCSAKAVKMILCDVCERLLPKDELKDHLKGHERLCNSCGRVCMGDVHFMRHQPHCTGKLKVTNNQSEEITSSSEAEVVKRRKFVPKKTLRAFHLAKNMNRKLTAQQEKMLEEYEPVKRIFEDFSPKVEDDSTGNQKMTDDENTRLPMEIEGTEDLQMQKKKMSSKNNGKTDGTEINEENKKNDFTLEAFVDEEDQRKDSGKKVEMVKKEYINGQIFEDLDQFDCCGQIQQPKKGKQGKGKKKNSKVKAKIDIISAALSMSDICEESDASQILETEVRHFQESESERLNHRDVIIDTPSNLENITKNAPNPPESPEISHNIGSFLEESTAESRVEELKELGTPISEPIINYCAMLKSNGLVMTHLNEWLLQSPKSNDVSQTWICRHCGKQLNSRDEGLHHMVRSHPTNKTTKAIINEISHLKRKLHS